jgi:hypothetical protein
MENMGSGNIDSGSEEFPLRHKRFAAEKCLPENATWADITGHDSEESRKRFAAEKGLPENATWADITNSKK